EWLHDQPRLFSAVAKTDVSLLAIAREDFKSIMENRFSVTLATVRFLCRRLLDFQSRYAATNRPLKSSSTLENDRSEEAERSLTSFDKFTLLRMVSLFRTIPEKDLLNIVGKVQEHFYEQGAVILEKDHPGDKLFIVVSGLLRVYDQDVEFAQLDKLSVVGEIALLTDTPHFASVKTMTEAHLLSIDKKSLLEILEHYFESALSIIALLAERLYQTVEKSDLSDEKLVIDD
ncbi:cyclic nucleotide-binding domain-containing protein, partial [Magnetococcales bacterium HHB-1]